MLFATALILLLQNPQLCASIGNADCPDTLILYTLLDFIANITCHSSVIPFILPFSSPPTTNVFVLMAFALAAAAAV